MPRRHARLRRAFGRSRQPREFSAQPRQPCEVHARSARADLLLCGVGKVNAGAAVARCLRPEHALVVNIGIAGALDITVVAEGVEGSAQRDLLLRLGCDLQQGYLYGRPMSAAAFEAFMREGLQVTVADAASV